ncbi:flp pilus assembly protein CpaB [Rossellomorea oryzaecorticis]|uniref:Flp pilus assembly protein CpaB n=1 Tax=Rossellomorea oryzaecorticis TaxID=1396505 RepID=A0ABU9KC23_9BACI
MLESKRKAIIFIVLSLLLALTAGFFVLQKVRALNTQLGGMTEVIVAGENINSRTLLEPNQVTTMSIPNKFVTGSHITKGKDLKNSVSVVALKEGDIITKNMIKPYSNVSDANNRLVTMVSSDKVYFDEKLENLDRVDIIVSQTLEGKPKTELFMKDVRVANILSNKEEKFAGVKLEIAADEAPNLIHMQNYADSIRILKANVGKASAEEEPQEKQEESKTAETTQQEPEKEEQPKQEPKKEDADKKKQQ